MQYPTKSFWLTALFLGALIALSAWATRSEAQAETISPDAAHSRIVKLLHYFVKNRHYSKPRLDDDLSSIIFDRYLEHLDPNRSFFYAADIEEFEHIRWRLDNHIRRARLTSVYQLFDRFRARTQDRANYALKLLDNGFRFDIDERYRFDRRDSSWVSTPAAMDELWRQRVKNDYLSLKLSGKNDPEVIATLRDRYRQIQRRSLQFTAIDVLEFFANAYLASVDPHSRYFSPRARENFRIRMSLSLEGIGAVLRSDNEYTRVLRIVPGGAADIAGDLKAGDRIVGVGQRQKEPIVDVVGWRLDDVVDLIRGPKGTLVRLELIPAGNALDADRRVIHIVRDKIKLQEQAAKKSIINIDAGERIIRIGVIEIPTFYVDFEARSRGDADYRSTTRDTLRLLAALEADGIDGLVIDLRGNGGGALTEAISLTGLFIETGPIIQIRNARDRVRPRKDLDKYIAYHGPLAVLIDRNSASASEIFAGAIQDYRRGLIIGEPTFGKGTVQNLYDLDRYSKDDSPLGQLKITTAQFFRVDGNSTQHRGIVPDITLPTTAVGNSVGERALDNALPWSKISATRYVRFKGASVVNELEAVRASYKRRLMADPHLIFVRRNTTLDQRVTEQETVSLLEAVRRDEREQREQARETLLFDLQRDTDTSAGEGDDTPIGTGSRIESMMLREASRILADALSSAETGQVLADHAVRSKSSRGETPISPPAGAQNAVTQ